MKETAFRQYLSEKKVPEVDAEAFIRHLSALQTFMKKVDLDAIPKGNIVAYTEHLVKAKSPDVLGVLRALLHYGNFSKNYNYIVEVIDIAEAYNAMDTLYQRVGEQFGEATRDAIFDGIELPLLGVNPDGKAEVTKVVMQRLEEQLGEEQTVALLTPCLHGRPIEQSLKDREDLLRLQDIDAFLALKREEMLERMRTHLLEGTLEYAQYIDADVLAYIERTPTVSPGIREGTRIVHTKIPYQIKQMLMTDDPRMKRFYVCYCPWIRGAIKNGTAHDISANFCHCSAGFTKKHWDVVFDQPVTVEPIETALTGALHCKFAVQIPKEYQQFIK